jgi:hypothetical protein
MARPEDAADAGRRMRRRHRSYSELDERGKEAPDLEEVRRVRVERLEGSTSTMRPTPATTKMASESQASLRSTASHRRKEPRRDTVGVSTKHRSRRKENARDDDDTTTYVYGKPADRVPSRAAVSEVRRLGRDGDSSEEEEGGEKGSKQVEKPKKRKIRVIYVTDDDPKSSKSGDRRYMTEKELLENLRGSHDSARRSRAHISRRTSVVAERPASPPKR